MQKFSSGAVSKLEEGKDVEEQEGLYGRHSRQFLDFSLISSFRWIRPLKSLLSTSRRRICQWHEERWGIQFVRKDGKFFFSFGDRLIFFQLSYRDGTLDSVSEWDELKGSVTVIFWCERWPGTLDRIETPAGNRRISLLYNEGLGVWDLWSHGRRDSVIGHNSLLNW